MGFPWAANSWRGFSLDSCVFIHCDNQMYRHLCFLILVDHFYTPQMIVLRNYFGVFWIFLSQTFLTINFADLHFKRNISFEAFGANLVYLNIFSERTYHHLDTASLYTLLGSLINALDAYEFPAPVSSNARHLILFTSTTTTG